MENLDLNLLTALDVLLDEASVTGAARRFGLSPSAMSRTLTRLRSTTGDPLYQRLSCLTDMSPFSEPDGLDGIGECDEVV
ncbi:LysR family transcriptional regulator, partial [Gluconobacter kondonii]|uniref:LysR family transcriptional regulator n=1 Tax=Gluconobacter kondonii TaxID=941463 RepID=UPI0020A0A18E